MIGQNSTVGLFSYSNNLNTTLTSITMRVNETNANFVIFCDDSNNSSLGNVLTTSNVTIATTITVNSTGQIWCWGNMSGLVAAYKPKITIKGWY